MDDLVKGNTMFRTQLKANPIEQLMGIDNTFVSIGSCFAQTIGNKLNGGGLDCLNNPFGTVFNPISLAQLLQDKPLDNFENRFLERDGVFYHYGLPSAINALSIELLKKEIEIAVSEWQSKLQKANYLLLTLGTALSYNWITDGFAVANNHKQPAHNFKQQMLTSAEIVNALLPALKEVISKNPNLKIIATVSPVRHTKQGIENNFLSKSILRVALAELQVELGEAMVYFPAFELLTDDLRDYRFYADDMVHPSAVAEVYIWQFFQQTYFSENLRQYVRLAESRHRALNHKPTHTQGMEFMKWQSFIALLDEQLAAMKK